MTAELAIRDVDDYLAKVARVRELAERIGVYLADLDTHRIPSVGAARGQMVYWALDSLGRLCSFEDLMATPSATQQLELPLFFPPMLFEQTRLF